MRSGHRHPNPRSLRCRGRRLVGLALVIGLALAGGTAAQASAVPTVRRQEQWYFVGYFGNAPSCNASRSLTVASGFPTSPYDRCASDANGWYYHWRG